MGLSPISWCLPYRTISNLQLPGSTEIRTRLRRMTAPVLPETVPVIMMVSSSSMRSNMMVPATLLPAVASWSTHCAFFGTMVGTFWDRKRYRGHVMVLTMQVKFRSNVTRGKVSDGYRGPWGRDNIVRYKCLGWGWGQTSGDFTYFRFLNTNDI